MLIAKSKPHKYSFSKNSTTAKYSPSQHNILYAKYDRNLIVKTTKFGSPSRSNFCTEQKEPKKDDDDPRKQQKTFAEQILNTILKDKEILKPKPPKDGLQHVQELQRDIRRWIRRQAKEQKSLMEQMEDEDEEADENDVDLDEDIQRRITHFVRPSSMYKNLDHSLIEKLRESEPLIVKLIRFVFKNDPIPAHQALGIRSLLMPKFNGSEFLQGAIDAFPTLMDAYYKGDIQLLEQLCSKKMYEDGILPFIGLPNLYNLNGPVTFGDTTEASKVHGFCIKVNSYVPKIKKAYHSHTRLGFQHHLKPSRQPEAVVLNIPPEQKCVRLTVQYQVEEDWNLEVNFMDGTKQDIQIKDWDAEYALTFRGQLSTALVKAVLGGLQFDTIAFAKLLAETEVPNPRWSLDRWEVAADYVDAINLEKYEEQKQKEKEAAAKLKEKIESYDPDAPRKREK